MVAETRKTDEHDAWFRSLRDRQAKARINARIRLCRTAGKPVGGINAVGDGVGGLRSHFGPRLSRLLRTEGRRDHAAARGR